MGYPSVVLPYCIVLVGPASTAGYHGGHESGTIPVHITPNAGRNDMAIASARGMGL
jgi:hypothetical protein